MGALDRVEQRLNRIGLLLVEWWVWPALMLALGLLAVVASWVVYPLPGMEQLWIWGSPFGETCQSQVVYGVPCHNCGMTRSWVNMARGRGLVAVAYNPAGAALWLALVWGGTVGALRLIRRTPELLRLSWPVWTVLFFSWWGLWAGHQQARLRGFNPLPEDRADPQGTEDTTDGGSAEQ